MSLTYAYAFVYVLFANTLQLMHFSINFAGQSVLDT